MKDEKNSQEGAEATPGTLPGGVTQSQVKDWKKEHGSVFQITVPHSEAGEKPYACYLKKPDRKTLQAAMAVASTNPIKMNEILLQNCWLGGDKGIQTNDDLFLSASAKLGELFNIKEAEVKEL